ncbi:hypothetical protein Gpo141_00005141 [Globisporangium polare]
MADRSGSDGRRRSCRPDCAAVANCIPPSRKAATAGRPARVHDQYQHEQRTTTNLTGGEAGDRPNVGAHQENAVQLALGFIMNNNSTDTSTVAEQAPASAVRPTNALNAVGLYAHGQLMQRAYVPPSSLVDFTRRARVHSYRSDDHRRRPSLSFPPSAEQRVTSSVVSKSRTAHHVDHVSSSLPVSSMIQGIREGSPVTGRRSRASSSSPAAGVLGALGGVSKQSKLEKKRGRMCKIEGCENYIVHKGLCCRHGGGKKCSIEGCNTSAKHSGLCWRHGGSTECDIDGCTKRAKARGHCWAHGGSTKCINFECEKVAVSGGLCWAHGGGKRCNFDECSKPAYERMHNFCTKHHAEMQHVNYFEV